MKLTVAELMVVIDTLRGSTRIADRSDVPLFGYTSETRRLLCEALTERANQLVLEVTTPT